MMSNKRKILFLQLVFLLAHFFLIFIMLKPYIGIDVQYNNGQITISNIYDNDGWARYTNLTIGDTILEVDNTNVTTFNTLFKHNNCFVHGSSIKIIRNNEIQYIQAPSDSLKDTFQEIIIPSIFSLTVFILTLFIYQQNSKVAFYLTGFLLSVSLSFFASTESGRGDFISNIIVSVFFPLGSLFLAHFIRMLLIEKGIKINWQLFFRINGFICLAIISSKLLTLFFNNDLDAFNTILVLSYFCFNICFSILLLIYFYLATKGSHHEVFLKWLILIHVCAFVPFIFLHAVPFIFRLPYIQDDLAAFTLFIIPIGYTYIVLTNRLIDINFILKQIPYYVFLTFIPTLILTIFVISERFYSGNIILYFIILFLAILTINIVTLFLKERLDFQLKDSLLYHQSFFSKNLNEFSQKLASVMKEDDLENLLLHQIKETLDPKVLLLIRINYKTTEYQCFDFMQNNAESILADSIKLKLRNNHSDILIDHPNYLGIQLYEHHHIGTYIWLSKKRNNTTFNLHEKMWLINIVKYVRLVYENLNIVKNIIATIENRDTTNHQSSNTLTRFLLQLSEQERKRLASDLHDSALQDQTIWYQKLDQLIQNSNTLQKEDLETLNKIKNGLLDVIKQIRDTCSELRPNFLLNTNFTASLEDLCKKKQAKASFSLRYEFQLSNYANNHNLTVSIYRVLQELLTNAEKHSNATLVSIEMWEDNHFIFLDYRDNGVGMDKISEQYNEDHIGLIGIKERIHILDGEIEFITELTQGLQILITIPR
ncbi:sensor histidine kinase [Lysinibacillus pakistanensis]|uniref:histidine kinase n=1 Tax=Lysinibacillus pakistanensis TaxID=759811 RepID=A0ABX6D618_9BACI|nr:sensor histidine kinase [Lysinibacillus pakistanensis]